MDKTNLYIIHDEAGQSIVGNVWQSRKDSIAAREFYDMLTKGGTPLNEHPEDYNLIKIGELDIDTGDVTPNTSKDYERKIVASGRAWRDMQNPINPNEGGNR